MSAPSATQTSSSQSLLMPSPSLPPLTLILAATSKMGIGFQGSLPWPSLKQEMAYFARITKRPPPTHTSSSSSGITEASKGENGGGGVINAVIMGRKTWTSIPPKYRPLRDRINVVVSRHPERLDLGASESVLGVGSIEEGLRGLERRFEEAGKLGRVFVIGGAEIYRATLGMRETERILYTAVKTEFECDTFFPIDLLGNSRGGEGDEKKENSGGDGEEGRWVRKSREEHERWVGEEIPGGVVREGEVEYEFMMFERA
ncbi:MAG: dihydrofolate reductase [Candelina submexicana]|nr:MAG: dihydrofolate reductase [Candelina submexicana]